MDILIYEYFSAESKPEECKNQFIGAVVWTRRLGNAAKLGAQVLMRQPDNSDLFKPTPVISSDILSRDIYCKKFLLVFY